MFKNVKELVQNKALVQVSPDDSIRNTCKTMNAHQERCVVVMDAGKLVGIVSERDVVHKCIATGLDLGAPVSEIMTTNIKTVQASDPISVAMDFMAQGKFHHIPVMDGDSPLAMLSSDDIPEEYRMLLERFREFKTA